MLLSYGPQVVGGTALILPSPPYSGQRGIRSRHLPAPGGQFTGLRPGTYFDHLIARLGPKAVGERPRRRLAFRQVIAIDDEDILMHGRSRGDLLRQVGTCCRVPVEPG